MEVGFGRTGLKLRRQHVRQGAPHDVAGVARTELLVRWKREAQLDQAPVKEGIARLDTPRGGRTVCNLERMGNEAGRQQPPVFLARCAGSPDGSWVPQPVRQERSDCSIDDQSPRRLPREV